MDDRLELAAVEPAQQIVRRHHVRHLPLAEVAPLLVRAECVVDDDVGPSGLVEACDEIRADEPGSAGDQQHPHPAMLWPNHCPTPAGRATCLTGWGKRLNTASIGGKPTVNPASTVKNGAGQARSGGLPPRRPGDKKWTAIPAT